jgi:capsular polysaccharide export protein
MFRPSSVLNAIRVRFETEDYIFSRARKYIRMRPVRLRKQRSATQAVYPYDLVDPFTLPEPNSGLENLFLVGSNWQRTDTKKPIALLVGVNDWKYGFMADYLPEYRCAFAPMKKKSLFFWRTLQKMAEKPQIVIIWGYNEPRFFSFLLKQNGIPLARAEDAFIRSAQLGADHTPPYSLVFDRSGSLYYDASQPSNIENIFNQYNFDANPRLLKQAEEALALIRRLAISKYNPPTITTSDPFKVLTRRRCVAVIGQVDRDQSILKGNVDRWTVMQAIKLAAYENPDCDIVYRPHPEVYKGMQRSKAKAKRIQKLCRISPPQEGFSEFLEGVDHVYVITSLSGLEALLHGKQVTVLGAPFYAGWGVTDDRAKLKRRDRRLSLMELFAGAYLLYPRYLGALEDSHTGLMAACRRIQADRIVDTQKAYKLMINQEPDKEVLLRTAQSDYWPALLFGKKGQAHENFDDVIRCAPFFRSLKEPECLIYQATLLHAVCGALKTDSARNAFLQTVRDFIDQNVYAAFLRRLASAHPGQSCTLQWSWLLEKVDEVPRSFELIQEDIRQKTRTARRIAAGEEEMNRAGIVVPLDLERKKLIYTLYEKCLGQGCYDDALEHIYTLLINGDVHTGLLLPIIKVAELTFDVTSARLVSDMLKRANITGHNNAGVNYHVECLSTTPGEEALDETLEAFALQLTLNPDRVNRTLARLNDFVGRAKGEALSHAILAMDGARSVRMANAWLELNRPHKALAIMKSLIENGERGDDALVAYSRALAGIGAYAQAIVFMERGVSHSPSKANYTELLRLLKMMGRFDDAWRHHRDALGYQVDLPLEGPVMPIYFGLKRIEEGFRCFLNTAMRDRLITYFGAGKYQDTENLEMNDILLLCDFGPAEEIRYSVLLPDIGAKFGYDAFSLSCDPRLLPLFSRSFPQARFVPTRRTREFSAEFPHAEFDRLPGSDLRRVMDNSGVDAVQKAEKIMLFSETFWHFKKNYSDFGRTPYLLVDAIKTAAWHKRLPKNTRLIGLSWRSQLTNSMRNVHYLSIEELEPLFMLEGVTYVNLQYDDCAEELAWVEARYPGKLIHFDDLDQFNDFDGVAALMSALDLVIGPCTTVIELAGAIGRPGLFFSNHGEMWWREFDDERTDVWYECIRHVRGKLGDKSSIVAALIQELKR